jgi:hypothetical protein
VHYTCSSAFWLQSIGLEVHSISWHDSVAVVYDRFERDKLDPLLFQFFHMKQTSRASDFVEQFDVLVVHYLIKAGAWSNHEGSCYHK